MKKLVILVIIMILTTTTIRAVTATYTWSGSINQGTIHVGNLTLNITKTISNSTIILITEKGKILDVLEPNKSMAIDKMKIQAVKGNKSIILTITSQHFFTITLTPTVSKSNYAFSWCGFISMNQTIYLNNDSITLLKGPILRIQTRNGTKYMEKSNATLQGLFIEMTPKNKTVVRVMFASNRPLSVTFKPINPTSQAQTPTNNTPLLRNLTKLKSKIDNLTLLNSKLKKENTALNTKITQMNKQFKSFQGLKTKLTNLSRKNIALKSQIANLTQLVNQLKAQNQFLQNQNAEYHKLLTSAMSQESNQQTRKYVQEAKKKELIGMALWKALIITVILVAIAIFLLYKLKRRGMTRFYDPNRKRTLKGLMRK